MIFIAILFVCSVPEKSNKDLRNINVAKAEEELTYADKFDVVLVNDNLEEALGRAEKMVADFQAK